MAPAASEAVVEDELLVVARDELLAVARAERSVVAEDEILAPVKAEFKAIFGADMPVLVEVLDALYITGILHAQSMAVSARAVLVMAVLQ